MYDDYVPVEKKEPREAVTTRLRPEALAIIDEFAAEEDRTRSDMVRILVSEAVQARMAKREADAAKKGRR